MRIFWTILTFLALSVSAVFSAEHTVNIQSFAFDQAELSIAVGDSVRFVNNDGAPHTATADDGTFDTGRLGRGDAFVVVFSNAGTFSYFCNFHRNMTASIIVQ